MKKITFAILLCMFFLFANAQSIFQKLYNSKGYSKLFSVVADSNGYAALGFSDSLSMNNTKDILFIKTDLNGVVQVVKTYDYFKDEDGTCIQITADGGYIISGSTEELDSPNYVSAALLIKIDSAGNVQWSKAYQRDSLKGTTGLFVHSAFDEGYVLVGASDGGTGGTHLNLIKTDNLGNVQWSKAYGSGGLDFANKIYTTNDSCYMISGINTSANSNQDFCLIKVNQTGNIVWSKTYGTPYYEWFSDSRQTSDGGYIIAGATDLYPSQYTSSSVLIKTDSNGNIQWSKKYNVQQLYIIGISVEIADDLGFVITGTVYDSIYQHNKTFLFKTDSAGNPLWQQKFYLNYQEGIGHTVIKIPDGYIIAGEKGIASENACLIKTDLQGNTCDLNASFSLTESVAQISSGAMTVETSITINEYSINLTMNSSFSEQTICTGTGINNIKSGKISFNVSPIHPNPSATGIFTFSGSSINGITVTNVLGEKIKSLVIGHSENIPMTNDLMTNSTITINLSSYPQGIYFVRIQSGEEFSVHKVVYQ